jgi:SAM-dependent methyltransferase
MAPRSAPIDGDAHQAQLAVSGRRKALGAYYTPPALVEGVLDLALEPVLRRAATQGADAVLGLRIVDPACGDGRFLAAAGERLVRALVALGIVAEEAGAQVAERCLHGVDVDPAAVRLARGTLRRLGGGARPVARRVVAGDALVDPTLLPVGGFDVVVGNPPFLNQLGAATARTAEQARLLRERFGGAVGAYTDPAAAFLLLGVELARPDDGVVALVQPMSVLSARDAARVRSRLLERGVLHDLWVVGDAGFDAAVEVCVPVVARGAAEDRSAEAPPRTRLHRGPDRSRAADAPTPAGAASWSSLLAALGGMPERELCTAGRLGDLATATADFRDQYYGLAPHVVDRADADDATHPPLVTVGLVDPARLCWGERTTRFNKVRYQHPRVDRAALPEALQRWADARLVPKVLVATQTRVPEAVADPAGRLLPSVPMISVVPADPGDPSAVWRIAAVLTCPAVALVAVRRHVGSGRNARSLRLRAAEVLELPIPADRRGWDHAAWALQGGAPLAEVGAAMDAAYGLEADAELLAWWLALLPSL